MGCIGTGTSSSKYVVNGVEVLLENERHPSERLAAEYVNSVKRSGAITQDVSSVRVTVDEVTGKARVTVNHRGTTKFEKIRRITGYLVGTTDRFNDAKRAEERERVKHAGM